MHWSRIANDCSYKHSESPLHGRRSAASNIPPDVGALNCGIHNPKLQLCKVTSWTLGQAVRHLL
jgi:hypothetical protein